MRSKLLHIFLTYRLAAWSTPDQNKILLSICLKPCLPRTTSFSLKFARVWKMEMFYLLFVLMGCLVPLFGEDALMMKIDDLQAQVRSLQKYQTSMSENCNKAQKQVAFSAKLLTGIPFSQRNDIVIFNDVTTNIGNAYNIKTGIFTCPVSGLYMLSCNILSDRGDNLLLPFYHNGRQVMRPHTARHATEHSPGSDTVIIKAAAGDQVYAKGFTGTVHSQASCLDHMSRFTAVLIKAD